MRRRARESNRSTFSFGLIAAAAVTLLSIYLIGFYNDYESNDSRSSEQQNFGENSETFNQNSKRVLRYWGVSVRQWNPNGSLRTMNRVFRKLGYKFVNASNGDQWDVLWSIEYPFTSTIRMRTDLFKPMEDFRPTAEQRVNHFPGIQFMTNKRFLGTFTRSQYLLPAFTFPEDKDRFRKYSAANPDAVYVEKNYNNRGVRVVTVDKFDRTNEEKIYQRFMDKPFLIDGHAFDFGVYVLISSVDPLRIYRYDHEVFIRFCPEKYHPFDSSNTRKYVVDDDHTSVYDMPVFREPYAHYGYTFKLIFESLLKDAGFDVDKFWTRVDDAIASIVLMNEKFIIDKIAQESLDTSINFFELVRFDMILDDELNPYVIEINMSPNLTPAGDRFEENVLIYEPLVYNTLRLVGAGSYDDFKSRISDDVISSNFKNLATNMKTCTENDCSKNCDDSSCVICLPCVNKDFIFHLHEAYREHVREGNFKRIFPSSTHFHDSKLLSTLSESNKVMLKWYEAKCESDRNWC